MTIKNLVEEMLAGGLKGADEKYHKIALAPFDKRDKEMLEGCGMVRFIANAITKKFYAFDSSILHDDTCDKIGIHYSHPPTEPIFFGIARWNRSTGKLKYHSNTGMISPNKENIKSVTGGDYKFTEPYIDGLTSYMEELRNRL